MNDTTDKQFISGRIVGGCSLHATHDRTKCGGERCPEPRCVDCCGIKDGRDIMECPRCGMQYSTSCTFDEDYS